MSPSEVLSPGYAAPLGVASEISAPQSGVAWSAVFAGGVTAAAISVILLLFGTGLGLATVSPWPGAGVSATTFTVLAAIWLIVVQWVSSFFGGYMAGRLRTKWVAVHSDEVFFRDTAHGFLAWALGTLIVVGVLSGVTGSAVSNGSRMAATVASSAGAATTYYVDLLFRGNAPGAAGASALGMSDPEMRAQAGTILAEGLANGGVPSSDSAYLAQLVSAKTGLAPAEAQSRVSDVLNREQAAVVKARQMADASRKAASAAAIYTFVSLLIGAFIASVAGAIGGRLRDLY